MANFEVIPPETAEEWEEIAKTWQNHAAELEKRIETLSMSNIKLIAELGEIARLLGAKPDMRSVLDEIEKLQRAAAPARDALDL